MKNHFGSNVTPRKFGKGSYIPKEWTCICGHTNAKHYSKCEMCGVSVELSKLAEETPDRVL